MKAKVLKEFRDKNTKKLYRAGQEIEVTKKRFEEINSTAFGVLAEEVKEEREDPETEKTEDGINHPAKGPSPGPVGAKKKSTKK